MGRRGLVGCQRLVAGINHLKPDQLLVPREKISRDAAPGTDYGNFEGCPKGCGKLILN